MKSKMRSEPRWVIVGEIGLYVGQWQTRASAIYNHCRDLMVIPSPRYPNVKAAWKACRKRGDRAVKATITYKEPK